MNVFGLINVLASSDSEGMFNRGWDIIGNLGDWALKMIYNFITFLLQVVYSIEGAFYYLTGLGNIRGLGSDDGISGLLPSINLNGDFDPGILIGQQSFQNALILMVIVGLVMAVFFLIYGCLKGAFNREGKTAAMIKMSIASTLRATLFLLFAPFVVMIVLGTITFCLGLVFQGLFSILLNFSFGDDGGTMQITSSSTSIAYNIYKACFLGGSNDLTDFYNAVYVDQTFNDYPSYFEHLDETKEILGIGANEICVVQYADAFSIIFFPLEDLVNKTHINFASEYSYGIGFAGGIFSLVALGILTIRAGERLFEILIDYFLCFPAISTMPIDNGQRLGQWSQLFLGRIINFSGSVIAMAVYIFVLGNIPQFLNEFEQQGGITAMFFKGIVLLVLIVAGAYACVKGGNTVAQLIGSAAAQAEANSMQQTMTLAHLGMHGLQLGGRFLSKGLSGGTSTGSGVFKNIRSAQSAKSAQEFTSKQNAVFDQILSGGVGAATGLAVGAGAAKLANNIPNLSKGESNDKGGDTGSSSGGKFDTNKEVSTQPSTSNQEATNSDSPTQASNKSPMQELKGKNSSKLTAKETIKNVAGTIGGSMMAGARNAMSSTNSLSGKIFAGAIGAATGLIGGVTGAAVAGAGKLLQKGGSLAWKGTKQGGKKIGRAFVGAYKKSRELNKEIKSVKSSTQFKNFAEYEKKVNHTSSRLINKEAKYQAKQNIENRKKDGGNK